MSTNIHNVQGALVLLLRCVETCTLLSLTAFSLSYRKSIASKIDFRGSCGIKFKNKTSF